MIKYSFLIKLKEERELKITSFYMIKEKLKNLKQKASKI